MYGAEEHNATQYPIELINTLLRDMMKKLRRIAGALSNLHPPNEQLLRRIHDLSLYDYTKNGHTARKMYDIIKDILKNKTIMRAASEGASASVLDENSLRSINDKFMAKYNNYYEMIRQYKSEMPQATALKFSNEVVEKLPISVGVRATGNNGEINMVYASLVEAEARLFNAPSHITNTVKYYPIIETRSKKLTRAKSMNRSTRNMKANSISVRRYKSR